MPRFRNPAPMDDTHRILMAALREALTSDYATHYKNGLLFADPGPGDMVLCQTSGIHRFTVGILEKIDKVSAHGIIREFGSDATCSMENERFIGVKIHKLCDSDLLYGKKRQIYEWILKAFWSRYNPVVRKSKHRFYPHNIEVSDGRASLTVRPHVFHRGCFSSYDRRFDWDSKTRLKDVVRAINLVAFEPIEKEKQIDQP